MPKDIYNHCKSATVIEEERRVENVKTTIIGRGGMGRLFGGMFSADSRPVQYVGRDVAADDLVDSQVIVVATPSSSAKQMFELLKDVPGIEGKLLICMWSYMGSGDAAFVDPLPKPVYLHFLFGPDIENLSGQNVVVAGDTNHTQFDWYLNKLEAKGLHVRIAATAEHDETVAYTQSLSQLSSILLGISLARSGYDKQQLQDFASLTFRLNRYTIERIMKQKAQLWAELQFENSHYPDVLNRYLDDTHEMATAIHDKDEGKFVELLDAAVCFWQNVDDVQDAPTMPTSVKSKKARADFVILGPAGTYSHEAAKEYIGDASVAFAETISAAVQAVQSDRTTSGIVPVENSIQGTVVEALDALYAEEMIIEDELVLDVNHVLCALERPQSNEDIRVIYSHAQALGQCREYLARHYPGVPQVATASTAAAMQKIVDQKDMSALAVGSEFSAELHGLTVIDRDIQDVEGNQTRFVVFSKKPKLGKKIAFTQIVIVPKADRPGLLFDILSIIQEENINMSHIESRPDRTELGSYIFYIRLDMASDDKRYTKLEERFKKADVHVRRMTA